MTVALLIPARYASQRFPGKPLAMLRGADGSAKTLIARTWEAALSVSGAEFRAIATDDDRIAAEAERIGAPVVMTSPDAANGTERCAEAAAKLPEAAEIVVNLQGDAPLTPPWFVEALISEMLSNPETAVATPVLRCDAASLMRFREDRRADRVGATTAVFDAQGRALYFSKEVIPFLPGPPPPGKPVPVFHHVGVYAYRRSALDRYMAAPSGPLERSEGLEQLRFLEAGVPIKCVEVDAQGAEFWELNNPEDVPTIEAVLAARGQT